MSSCIRCSKNIETKKHLGQDSQRKQFRKVTRQKQLLKTILDTKPSSFIDSKCDQHFWGTKSAFNVGVQFPSLAFFDLLQSSEDAGRIPRWHRLQVALLLRKRSRSPFLKVSTNLE